MHDYRFRQMEYTLPEEYLDETELELGEADFRETVESDRVGEDDPEIAGGPFLLREIEGALIVTPREASLGTEAEVAPLREGLLALLEAARSRRVVLDLGRVGSLSSRAVGLLMAHHLRLEREGGALRICRASAPVAALLEHVRLGELVRLFAELDEAVLSAWD